MKNEKRMLAGCYILISVFLFLSLVGCERGYYRKDSREYDRGYRHYYRDGRWYQRDSAGHEIVVAALAIGAIIDSLPPSHENVVVEGNSYYHDDRYYYRQHPNGGYVVVPPPAIVKSQSKSGQIDRGDRRDNGRNEENRGAGH